jgi:hypothetical protein
MSPLDLLISDSAKISPLTESRLRQAIFRPQAFDVTSLTPGDQSMIGQLYPPYRQNHGFGGGSISNVAGGMGKESSALEHFLQEGLHKSAARITSTEISQAQQAFPPPTPASGYLAPAPALAPPAIPSPTKAASVLKEAGLARIRRVAKSLGNNPPEDFATDPRVLASGYANMKWMRRAYKGDPSKYEKSRGYKDHLKDLEEWGKKKQGSVLQAIMPTLNEAHLNEFKGALLDDNIRLAYEKNAAATLGSLDLLLNHEPVSISEMETFIRPTVVQISRHDDGYAVKMASHKYWNPQTVYLSRGEAMQQLGEKIVLAADVSGATTVAEGADTAEEAVPDSDMQGMATVSEFGLYKVQTDDGQELIGYVIPNLIDVNGIAVPLALFTNGSQAGVQADIMGTPVQAGASELPTADVPSGYGAFFSQGPEGVQATIPLEIMGSFQGPQGPEGADPSASGMQATTFDGRQVEVSLQPNIQAVVPMDGKMLIPAHWQWVPLNKADSVSLVGGEDEAPKVASARRHYASVEIRSGGGAFSVRGHAVDKLAAASREFLNVDEAMFLLSGLGVDQLYGIQKLGEATAGRAPVQIRIGRFIKTADEQKKEAAARAQAFLERMPNLRRPLFKEASVITDPAAVDAVLSLGFINSENVAAFMSYLPEIEDAQSKICELLLAARLGLSNTSAGALEKAIRSTEEVLEGLKTLAFEGTEAAN